LESETGPDILNRQAIRPFDLKTLQRQLIRGQYENGKRNIQNLKAYREEEGVAAQSCTETYFAMKLSVDNLRWKGVPFYLQAGKRLKKKLTRRGGCIIRSAFLANIKQAFDTNPELENLLLDDFFRSAIHSAQAGWRRIAVKAIELGIPTPAISSGLAYYDGYRSGRLPANLLQAQRDYFGAHTYERIDKPRGEFFHTDWIGSGGNVSSTTYTV
jgi:6-phosphogluconate dehydrogenase, C-terminal domain/Glucose-6-phosphate dehydrogenase, C-terminal domain